MPKETTVTNLITGKTLVYSLSPEEAVVAAFEQQNNDNYNTWTYPAPEDHPRFHRRGKHVTCGQFTARSE